jgi:prepilin-type N-terminal cleavage/methylation domain-containing protein
MRGVTQVAPRIAGSQHYPVTKPRLTRGATAASTRITDHHRGGGTVNKLRARLTTVSDAESGMSLIEVVIAVSILAILATASLGLYLSGLSSTSAQQRRDVAITVANHAMESASAVPTAVVSSTGMSGLYTGRFLTAVTALWTADAAVSGVSQTYIQSDPTATSTSTPAIPLQRTDTISGTTYTTDTLIGLCYIPIAGGSCVKLAGYSTPPSTTPTGYAPYIRVIVVVRWGAGTSCAGGTCSYQTATLFNVSTDLEWNSHA